MIGTRTVYYECLHTERIAGNQIIPARCPKCNAPMAGR